MTPPVLVFGYGNPSRGDDGLGPAFVHELSCLCAEEVARGEVQLLTDFQLNVEHSLDLVGRSSVYFVDATLTGQAPFVLSRISPVRDVFVSTHRLSPGAVLQTLMQLQLGAVPETWVLAIRGECFDLGAPLSRGARAHLKAAVEAWRALTHLKATPP